jgi:hypothetical protein
MLLTPRNLARALAATLSLICVPAMAIEIPHDLRLATQEFRAFVEGPSFTAVNCAPILSQIYAELFHAPGTRFDVGAADLHAREIIDDIWRGRLALRRRLGEFRAARTVSPACVDAARDVLRAGRFMEDFLGERLTGQPAYDKKMKRPVFAGASPWLLTNDKIATPRAFDLRTQLKSGDILLSRGAAFTSAAIARIGNADSQFSHLALVHVDDITGRISIIEAHIELGVVVNSLDKYLADGKVRAALYRYPDAQLAKRAAEIMLGTLIMRKAITGENIPYDFALDAKNHDNFFCSEVVSYAFEQASRGAVQLPAFESRLDQTSEAFLDLLGVTARETFLPGDVEVDPRLELVAEWRDLTRTKDVRMKDAILTKMYEWMSRDGYVLKGNWKSWLAENVIWRARRWPLFDRLLKDKFPKNMSKKALGTIAILNDVVAAIQKELEAAQKFHESRYGVSMTAREMHDALEEIRADDAALYPPCQEYLLNPVVPKPKGKPKFHRLFSPAT